MNIDRSIGVGVFKSCTSLTSIEIPTGVTSIDDYAFHGCSSLTDVYYGGSEDEWAAISIGTDNTDLTSATIHYNSKMPTGTQGNTNSTSAGAPIIESATLTYGDETYDIFSQAITIEKDSDTTVSVEATVSGGENVKVYITQGIGGEMEIKSDSTSIQPGQLFSSGKTIYIMAVDANTGVSTAKATKLSVASTLSGNIGETSDTSGLNFKLGKDVGFTIPDKVPVFGGMDVAWSFDFIPISVEYDKNDDNKINVVFGTKIASSKSTKNGVERKYFSDFDFDTYKKDFKTAKNMLSSAGNSNYLCKLFEMSDGNKMSLFDGNVIAGGSNSSKGNIKVAGYAEMHYVDGQLVFSEGELAIEAEIEVTYNGQIFIWVVPLYYTIGGGIGIELEGKMINLSSETFTPEFDAYLIAAVSGKVGAGLGISGVATAGAEGTASLNFKTALSKTYLKVWGEGSAKFIVKVFGKKVANSDLLSGKFLIYETNNAEGLISDSNSVSIQSADDGFYDSIDLDAVYPAESREYAENPTEWLGGGSVSLMSADYTNKNLQKIAENIYTEAAPMICDIDGKTVMVMQWDNSERSDNDRSMLVYSVYENGAWSAPAAIDDDGTADFYPSFSDGWLVWQNQKTSITDDMSLTDIAENGEIYAAKWNGSGFDAPAALTDNSTLDTMPAVSANADGASAVWVTNSENNILGTEGDNTVMRADFDGKSWGEPYEIKTDLNAVINLSAGIADDEFCVAYVEDGDNDLETITEREIQIIKNRTTVRLTDNDVLDDNPVFADNMIYYYSGSNIAYSDTDGSNTQTVFAEAINGLTDTFTVGTNANGDTAVWWEKTDDGAAEVYCTLYRDGEWSDEIQITSVGNKAKYADGILNDDGSMLVAFNSAITEDNEIIQTDLYTISVEPSYDLELTDAYFDESNMTAYATVKNSGELAVDSYSVTLTDMQTQTITEPLKAGENADIAIAYDMPSDFAPKTVTLAVETASGDEYDTTNNFAEFEIGSADISVSDVVADEEETAVSAVIANEGYTDAESVTVSLRENSADGTVIDSKTISLDAGDSETVEFTIDKSAMRFYNAEKQLYVTAEYEGDEAFVGNNDGYVYIMSEAGSADYETNILNYSDVGGKYMINSVAVNNTDTAVICQLFTAVYGSDGVLKSCGTVEATIDAHDDTGVDITVDCDIESGDVIKAFMWKDQEALTEYDEFTIE